MRLSDIVTEAGFIDTAKKIVGVDSLRDIKTGFDAAGKPLQTLRARKSAAAPEKKSTPFNTVDPEEFKEILAAVLNKQELSARQQQTVKNLHGRL
jgi:hypothetical protein